MAHRERLARASVSRVIRRAVCKNAAVKSRDLANGRIHVYVCARVWVGYGRKDLGGVWQKGFGHAGRAPSAGVHACARVHSTPGLFTDVHMPVTAGCSTGAYGGLLRPQGRGHRKSQPCPVGKKDYGALLSLMRRCSWGR